MSDGARSECWTMLPYLRVDSVTERIVNKDCNLVMSQYVLWVKYVLLQ